MARRFVVAAQQALFRGARRLEGHVVVDAIVSGDGRDNRTEEQRGGKRRGVRCPLHEPPKINKRQTDATGQGRAKAHSIVIFPLNWRVAPPTPKPLPQAVLWDF